MAQCTAPINGHRSRSAAENCPACRGGRSRNYGYTAPSYSTPYVSKVGRSSGGGSVQSKPRWSRTGSSIAYTIREIQTLTPIRDRIEKLASEKPDLRDVFLCHAWDDRKDAAKELHDLLESNGVSVWFSEKDVGLGSTLLRSIDKGLANSKIGIVLVTPSFLSRIKGEGIADKELSVLLSRDRLIPIVHETTFEALRDVSPLLGSRSGLDTADNKMSDIAAKISELVTIY